MMSPGVFHSCECSASPDKHYHLSHNTIIPWDLFCKELSRARTVLPTIKSHSPMHPKKLVKPDLSSQS